MEIEIYYDRIIGTNEVKLTVTNCLDYGYTRTSYKDTSLEKYVYLYYPVGGTVENHLPYDDNGDTYINVDVTQSYTHIAPSPSKYQFSYADIDKEGSGRNNLTGDMYRERVGYYTKIDLAWDIIPNSKEYNNWYKILVHLPAYFHAKIITPSGEILDKTFYRTDVSTDLYHFAKNGCLWQGLSTSFVQYEIDNYDDSIEPTLEEIE